MLSRAGWSRALLRFARAEGGATAVEFALVAGPFLLLTVGLGEIAMIGFTQTSLDYAVSETARKVRTGEVQTDGVSASELRTELCETFNRVLGSPCVGKLFLDVRRFNSFVDAGSDSNDPMSDGSMDDSEFAFQPGAPSDIVVVRAYYRWDIITPFFEQVFGNTSSGDRVLSSTMMFRNEPFPDPNA